MSKQISKEVAEILRDLDELWADHDRDMGRAIKEIERLRAENERLRAALTPSGETKAAYMGEFRIRTTLIDDDGNEHVADTNVPWTTIKDIMAAISKRAALRGGDA